MAKNAWTDEENDLIVAEYFAMLAAEISGRPYKKSEHKKRLITRLAKRTGSAIEYKYQNISAVLQSLGEDWIQGYMPASNFQMALADAVSLWLNGNRKWVERVPFPDHAQGPSDLAKLSVGLPPTLRNHPPPKKLERMLEVARKFDVAGRDERNRALGLAGEKLVMSHERAVLADAGRDDLARSVRWVSVEDGDGAGYDIASFAPTGQARLIEVKTTNGWERTPFHISRNELAVADARRSEWRLFRIWNFSRKPKAFELRPPLDAHVSLTPTTFQASFS